MSILYCSSDASGANDGTSWNDAFITLSGALLDVNTDTSDSHLFVDGNVYDLDAITITNNLNLIGGQNPFTQYNHPNYTTVNISGINPNMIIDTGIELYIENFEFNTSGVLFGTDGSTSSLKLTNTNAYCGTFLNNSGLLTLHKSSVFSDDFGIISSGGTIGLSSANIKSDNIAISGVNTNITLSESKLYSNIGIVDSSTDNTKRVVTHNSLIKAQESGIILNSGIAYISNTTIDAGLTFQPQHMGNEIDDSVFLGTTSIASGFATISNTAFYTMPSGYETNNISLTKRPTFLDETHTDYTPMFGVAENIDTFELTTTDTSYIQNVEAQKLSEISKDVMKYKYLINNIFTISDYLKETAFADVLSEFSNTVITHAVTYKHEHILNDVVTKSAFPYDDQILETEHVWPYEWDYKLYDTSKVGDDKAYIIPRSIIDITSVLNDVFLINPNTASISNLEIATFKELVVNGLAYDYNNSTNTKIVTWSLTDDNVLESKNLYDNTLINSYHLLSKELPVEKNNFIQVSGLIPYGKTENGYKYTLEDKPNKMITGINENYMFEWKPTDINTSITLHGIVVYKDNIFVTGKYTTNGNNVIVVYPTKGTYEDYITTTPYVIEIGQNDVTFTDITVLENGSFLLASQDNNKLYNFIPRYDYAEINSNTVIDTEFMLREDYKNVTLSGIL